MSEKSPYIIPGFITMPLRNIPINQAIQIFSNPAKDFIRFNPDDDLEHLTVKMFDMYGNKVLDQTIAGGKPLFVSNLSIG